MAGVHSTEQRAQREFAHQVLTQVVALCDPAGQASVQRVEQAIGYYRHAADGNAVQQLLGRRLRATVASLVAAGLLAPGDGDTYRPTAAARTALAHARQPWWRRLLEPGRSLL